VPGVSDHGRRPIGRVRAFFERAEALSRASMFRNAVSFDVSIGTLPTSSRGEQSGTRLGVEVSRRVRRVRPHRIRRAHDGFMPAGRSPRRAPNFRRSRSRRSAGDGGSRSSRAIVAASPRGARSLLNRGLRGGARSKCWKREGCAEEFARRRSLFSSAVASRSPRRLSSRAAGPARLPALQPWAVARPTVASRRRVKGEFSAEASLAPARGDQREPMVVTNVRPD
jgi:hypothetical protein